MSEQQDFERLRKSISQASILEIFSIIDGPEIGLGLPYPCGEQPGAVILGHETATQPVPA